MNFLTPEEVAELLKVDSETVELWLKQKKLPGVKIGNVWRIEEGRLQEFLTRALDAAGKYEEYEEVPLAGVGVKRRGRKPTGKYDGLKRCLEAAKGDSLKMSFGDIEKEMSDKLPQSAYRLRPWWANDFSHSQARSWLHAGWETRNVDLEKRSVVFVKRK